MAAFGSEGITSIGRDGAGVGRTLHAPGIGEIDRRSDEHLVGQLSLGIVTDFPTVIGQRSGAAGGSGCGRWGFGQQHWTEGRRENERTRSFVEGLNVTKRQLGMSFSLVRREQEKPRHTPHSPATGVCPLFRSLQSHVAFGGVDLDFPPAGLGRREGLRQLTGRCFRDYWTHNKREQA